MNRFAFIITFTLLISCNSSEIKVTDPVTGKIGIVQNETFYKGIAYIQKELKPLLRKYYEQHKDIPKNIEEFNSVAGPNNIDILSQKYCSINTKKKESSVYISISLREDPGGCTNQIFWNVTLNNEQPRTLTDEDVKSLLKDALNNPYK